MVGLLCVECRVSKLAPNKYCQPYILHECHFYNLIIATMALTPYTTNTLMPSIFGKQFVERYIIICIVVYNIVLNLWYTTLPTREHMNDIMKYNRWRHHGFIYASYICAFIENSWLTLPCKLWKHINICDRWMRYHNNIWNNDNDL